MTGSKLLSEDRVAVVRGEINWLVNALDCGNYREGGTMRAAAEAILAKLRDCPPEQGFSEVTVPGERECDRIAASEGRALMIAVPIWARIEALASELGAHP